MNVDLRLDDRLWTKQHQFMSSFWKRLFRTKIEGKLKDTDACFISSK